MRKDRIRATSLTCHNETKRMPLIWEHAEFNTLPELEQIRQKVAECSGLDVGLSIGNASNAELFFQSVPQHSVTIIRTEDDSTNAIEIRADAWATGPPIFRYVRQSLFSLGGTPLHSDEPLAGGGAPLTKITNEELMRLTSAFERQSTINYMLIVPTLPIGCLWSLFVTTFYLTIGLVVLMFRTAAIECLIWGRTNTRCPQCGRPLRTNLAEQCFACGADWHDHDCA